MFNLQNYRPKSVCRLNLTTTMYAKNVDNINFILDICVHTLVHINILEYTLTAYACALLVLLHAFTFAPSKIRYYVNLHIVTRVQMG